MSITSTIIIIGIVNGFLEGFALLLLVHRGNRRANAVLGFLILILSVSISGMLFMDLDLYAKYPYLLLITQPLLFLFGPLFWLYVRLITHRIERLKAGLLVHAIPFFLSLIYLVSFYLPGRSGHLAFFEKWNTLQNSSDLTLTVVQLSQIVIYFIVTLGEVRRHQAAIKKEYSSIQKINLQWVKTVIFFTGLFAFMMGILLFLHLLGMQSFVHTSAGLLGILLPLGLGFYGLRQPEIFLGLIDSPDNLKKYERSALTPEKADMVLRQLLETMETEKPYHNNDLTIHDLAARLSIPVHHLSQTINDRLNQNFYDFVNRFRVEEVKRQIAEPDGDKYTLMAIALNAGFNSKSVFNTAFRKYTGVTPSEYRKRLCGNIKNQ